MRALWLPQDPAALDALEWRIVGYSVAVAIGVLLVWGGA